MRYNSNLKLAYIGMTDTGNVRELNEDTILVNGDKGVFVVADGMGGHGAGDKASQMICQILENNIGFMSVEDNQNDIIGDDDVTVVSASNTISNNIHDEIDEYDDITCDFVPNPIVSSVSKAVILANREVFRQNSENGFPEGQGMGSTVAGIWVYSEDNYACLFHIGDSRIYRHRRNELIQMTTDHSLYEEWVRTGQVGTPPKKNILVKAMGPFSHVEPDTMISMLNKDDIFLICSDGLTGMLSDTIIADILNQNNDIKITCQELITKAKEYGGKDNISVILIQIV